MVRRNTILISVLCFNALTALMGGIGLVFGMTKPPVGWLEHSVFSNYVVPGLILFFLVGGSAAFGAYSVITHKTYYKITAGLSGVIMLSWITGEILVLRHFSWLQVLYYATGLLVVTLAAAEPKSSLLFFHSHTGGTYGRFKQ